MYVGFFRRAMGHVETCHPELKGTFERLNMTETVMQRIRLMEEPAPQGDGFKPETILSHIKGVKRVYEVLKKEERVIPFKTNIEAFISELSNEIKNHFQPAALKYNRQDKCKRGREQNAPRFAEFTERTKPTIIGEFQNVEKFMKNGQLELKQRGSADPTLSVSLAKVTKFLIIGALAGGKRADAPENLTLEEYENGEIKDGYLCLDVLGHKTGNNCAASFAIPAGEVQFWRRYAKVGPATKKVHFVIIRLNLLISNQ